VSVETIFGIAFAVCIVVAAVALAAAATGRIARRTILAAAGGIGVLGVAAWVAFALEPSGTLAVAAGGILACLLATLGALAVDRALARSGRIEAQFSAAERRLQAVIDREATERAAELERTLARARADAASLLAEEERRIADARRATIVERERAAGRELTEALAATQRRVEQRLAEWGEDLERAQTQLAEQQQRLATRQRRLIEEAEERLRADAEGLESESEAQRAGLIKLRQELEHATEEAIAASRSELDTHAVERRRALQELAERMRQRERELQEAAERAEAEALQRLNASLGDVERRLVDRLGRVVERSMQQHTEAATIEFADAIKRSREDAARRLARELERAVAAFSHEAEGVLGERLANVGDAAAQRFERRLDEAATGLERQREELASALESRIAAAETDMRRRLGELSADAEAERGVLEARLHELQRRIDQSLAHAETLDSA
jgi:hypothetical protein